MRLEHVALWTARLEAVAEFYAHWFGAEVGPAYHNPAKRFESRFLTFPSGARLELMRRPEIQAGRPEVQAERPERQAEAPAAGPQIRPGWAHVAFSVGAPEAVDALTGRLRAAGVPVIDGPRWTGDGYYESVVVDPDGNLVEITV